VLVLKCVIDLECDSQICWCVMILVCDDVSVVSVNHYQIGLLEVK